MNPWDLFNPAKYNPLDPQQLFGQLDPARLVDAAHAFPGGPALLVFALFFAPVGPGIPAGVVLANHVGINPLLTMALYTVSDVLGACVCHPMYAGLRRVARHVPLLRRIGRFFMKIAMFGARVPKPEDFEEGVKGLAPALFRIGTVGFGLDVYHGGMLVAGLRVPRILGWSAAIAGDLVWFAVLLVTSIITAAVVSDDRIQFVVMIVAMFVLPMIAKRIFPVLRDPPREPRAPRLRPAVAAPIAGDALAGTMAAPLQPAFALAGPGGATIQVADQRTAAVAASYLSRSEPVDERPAPRRAQNHSRAAHKPGRARKRGRR